MEFRLLGPLEGEDRGVLLQFRGRHERALLAFLLLHAGQVVPPERLIELLWQGQPPAGAAHSLQTYVSRLRKTIGSDGVAIEFQPTGYRLRARPEQLDLRRFEGLIEEGWQLLAAGDPETAEERLDAALALWRGPPLLELPNDPEAEIEATRLDELRLSALEGQIEAQLDRGRDGDLVGKLQTLVAAYPLREGFHRQLMLALYRSGRQAEALEVFQQARRELIDQLGIEPGTPLKDLQEAILRHDASLEPAPPEGVPRPTPGAHRPRVLLVGLAALLVTVVVAIAVAASGGDHRSTPVVVPDSVVAVDAATHRVVHVFPIGESPGPMAFAGRYVFVVGLDQGTLYRIDTRSGAFTTSRRFDASGTDLAVERNRWIWVASSGAAGAGHASLTRVLSDPLVYSDRIDLAHSAKPVGLAVGGGSLWVAEDSPTAPAVSRWSLATLRRERLYALAPADYPGGVTFRAARAWVAVPTTRQVLRIDARSGAITHLRVDPSPRSAALAYGSLWLYGYEDPTVWRVDPATGALQAAIPVSATPQGLTAGGGSVWVTDCAGVLSRIDPRTNSVVDAVKTGYYPRQPTYRNGAVWVPTAGTDSALGLCERRGAR